MIAYLVAGIPYFVIILIIPLNNVLIYRHVKRQMLQKKTLEAIQEMQDDSDDEHMAPSTLELPEGAPTTATFSNPPSTSSHDDTNFTNEGELQQTIRQDWRRKMARRQDSEVRRRHRLQRVVDEGRHHEVRQL